MYIVNVKNERSHSKKTLCRAEIYLCEVNFTLVKKYYVHDFKRHYE